MYYPEAITFLFDLTKFGFNFGLGRITRLLELLGNPQRGLRVVHVGGTNGKGSTVAMLDSILRAAGYPAGTFTSPHLDDYTERITVDGSRISEVSMAGMLTSLRPLLERMVQEGEEQPTEFEVLTALALLHFQESGADPVVLEVGLGGAIDSTNVVDQPLATVLTNVAMDHMDYLGQSIAEIASVKAGIIKQGRPCVTAVAHPDALAVIRETSRARKAPLIQVGRDVTWREEHSAAGGQVLSVTGRRGTYNNLFLPLPGRHQQINCATALAVIEVLADEGVPVSEEALRTGLAGVRWPGRLEVLHREPVVLVDVAHNLDGARALRAALLDIFSYRRLVLVIGMLADKEREKVLAELAPLAGAVVVTKPHSPRAGNWQEMTDLARQFAPEVYCVEDTGQAVEKGLSLVGPADLLCVTGSFYMVAEARSILLHIFNR